MNKLKIKNEKKEITVNFMYYLPCYHKRKDYMAFMVRYITKRFDVSYYNKHLNQIEFLKHLVLNKIQNNIISHSRKIPLLNYELLSNYYGIHNKNVSKRDIDEIEKYFVNRSPDKIDFIDKYLFYILKPSIKEKIYFISKI